MNARKVLELMARTDRGNMTVWSPTEVRTHIDAYRAEVLAEAADMVQAMADPGCHCGGCDSCAARGYADQLRKTSGKDTGDALQAPVGESTRDHWQAIAESLNALAAAGTVGIDLEGVLTDHLTRAIVWDRTTERWLVACSECDRQILACGHCTECDRCLACGRCSGAGCSCNCEAGEAR